MLKTRDYFRVPVFNTIAQLSCIDEDLVYFEILINGHSEKFVIDVITMSIGRPEPQDEHFFGQTDCHLEIGGFVSTCLDPRVDVKKVLQAPELQRFGLKFFKNYATGGIRFSSKLDATEYPFESVARVFLKDSQN